MRKSRKQSDVTPLPRLSLPSFLDFSSHFLPKIHPSSLYFPSIPVLAKPSYSSPPSRTSKPGNIHRKTGTKRGESLGELEISYMKIRLITREKRVLSGKKTEKRYRNQGISTESPSEGSWSPGERTGRHRKSGSGVVMRLEHMVREQKHRKGGRLPATYM